LRPLRLIKPFPFSSNCHRMVNTAASTARQTMRDGPRLLNR
jgi:hypothetical protein